MTPTSQFTPCESNGLVYTPHPRFLALNKKVPLMHESLRYMFFKSVICISSIRKSPFPDKMHLSIGHEKDGFLLPDYKIHLPQAIGQFFLHAVERTQTESSLKSGVIHHHHRHFYLPSDL